MPKFVSLPLTSLSDLQTHVLNYLLVICTWIFDRQFKLYVFEVKFLIQTSIKVLTLSLYSLSHTITVSYSDKKNLESSWLWVIFDICLSLMPHIQSISNSCKLNLGNIFRIQTASLHFYYCFPNLTVIQFLLNYLNYLKTGLSASILAFAQSAQYKAAE